MKIKLSKEQTKELVYEELEDFELAKEGDWQVDYKWQRATNIVQQISTGKFFSYNISRSGSPYSDYYYSYEDKGTELVEVVAVLKTTVVSHGETILKTIVEEDWEEVSE